MGWEYMSVTTAEPFEQQLAAPNSLLNNFALLLYNNISQAAPKLKEFPSILQICHLGCLTPLKQSRGSERNKSFIGICGQEHASYNSPITLPEQSLNKYLLNTRARGNEVASRIYCNINMT